MKKYFYLPVLSVALIYSCGAEPTSDNPADSESSEEKEVAQTLDVELPDDPCELISKELVTTHFDVSADELEEDSYNREGIHWTESCSYKWKKENFEEINKANQEKLLASMKKGSVKDAVKTGKEIEQPHKSVGVTNLRKFESIEKAQTYFKNSHRKPSKEDMEKLDKEFEKQSDEKGLSEDQKETGKSLAGGIVDNMKFMDVEGIGDMASWDDLGSKLDVLVGDVQFGVKVHTGEGVEKDIEKAKAVAADILKNF
tara:strand:+ start:58072 stop:58839 length:768 start_codon:yes stop_codon:yes gene_type:complete